MLCLQYFQSFKKLKWLSEVLWVAALFLFLLDVGCYKPKD